MEPTADPYYRTVDDGVYDPTEHVQGAWNDAEQHMAPLSAIIVHEALRAVPRPDLLVGRVSLDILGFLPLDRTTIRTEVLRPGRSIELIEAVASVAGRDVVRTRIWRLLPHDSHATHNLETAAMPARQEMANPGFGWPGGYIRSLDTRISASNRPGRGHGWLRTNHPVCDTGEPSALIQLLAVADCANGMSPAADPREWMFPNVDLTLHILREPTGDWLGLDVNHEIDTNGVGVTSATMHDDDGPFGRLAQILTVRPHSGQ